MLDSELDAYLSTEYGAKEWAAHLHELVNNYSHKKEANMAHRQELLNNPPVVEFELSNNSLVTDPCYPRYTWCAGSIKTKPGKWKATVIYSDENSWGIRNSTLLCWHTDFEQSCAENAGTKLPFEVGVDSGQAGVFCDTIYPQTKEDQGEYGDLNTFYGKACNLTCETAENFGVIDGHGVVSSSGYGDGGYSAYGESKDGEYIALRIEFIPNYTDDESEKDEEDID